MCASNRTSGEASMRLVPGGRFPPLWMRFFCISSAGYQNQRAAELWIAPIHIPTRKRHRIPGNRPGIPPVRVQKYSLRGPMPDQRAKIPDTTREIPRMVQSPTRNPGISGENPQENPLDARMGMEFPDQGIRFPCYRRSITCSVKQGIPTQDSDKTHEFCTINRPMS